MKKRLISIIIAIPMIFTACLSEKSKTVEKKEEFNKVLSEVNKQNEEMKQKKLSIDEKYINWLKREDDLTDEEYNNIAKYSSSKAEPEVLSAKEAKEDVDMLFRIFRCCYAAYGYFGGDEVFFKAKENILKSLEGKSEISNIEFKDLIRNNTSFLKDRHLYYNNMAYDLIDKISKRYYVFKDGKFFKDDSGYYKVTENKKTYIEEINGDKEISKFMKRTIGNDGELVYTVAVLGDLSNDKNYYEREANIQYLNGSNRTTEKVKLSKINDKTKDYKQHVYSIEKNVPIVQLRVMDDNQQEFIDSAIKLKEYPVSIIDLRGTGGGTVSQGGSWFENYTGEKCELNSVWSHLNSNYYRHKMLNENNIDISNKPLFEVYKQNETLNKLVPNKNIIFLLVDKANTSASEVFIEYMKQMYNVILVGTNTTGCTLSLNIYNQVLKNSGITLGVGSSFYVSPYFDGFEFKGFEPDIVVESSQALEKVQKLIQYYGLNEKK